MAFLSGLLGGNSTFGDYGDPFNPYGPPSIGIMGVADPREQMSPMRKRRGGLFGSGISGEELSAGIGALRSMLGGQAPRPAPVDWLSPGRASLPDMPSLHLGASGVRGPPVIPAPYTMPGPYGFRWGY